MNKKIKNLLLISLLAFLVSGVTALHAMQSKDQKTSKASLNFEDYPVEIFKGQAAKLVQNNELSKTYPTRLNEALNDKKDIFAGEYAVALWGCGSACSINAFVSVKTGIVLERTFGGECSIYIKQYQPNSRLLIGEGLYYDTTKSNYQYAEFYYLLENGDFKEIAKIDKSTPDDVRFTSTAGCG